MKKIVALICTIVIFNGVSFAGMELNVSPLYNSLQSPEVSGDEVTKGGIGLAVQWISGKKNFLVAPGLYPSDPYSTIAMTPPYGTLLNQTLMTLPPGFYFYD